MAGRLAEAGLTVRLLEAGPDIDPDEPPSDIDSLYPRSSFNEDYLWSDLKVTFGNAGSRAASFTAARVLGGGSSINGMANYRGLPADYDTWEALGATGWGWQQVEPVFQRVEKKLPLKRQEPREWPRFADAMGSAASRRGWPHIDDMNTDFADGYCRLPLSSTATRRASSASVYLNGAVRRQPRLLVGCGTEVQRLLFDEGRCIGASAIVAGTSVDYHADHVVLAAGGLFSPTILLRSGVGDAATLGALGIPTIADVPGVGANLQNHPIAFLATYLKPSAREPENFQPAMMSTLRYSSSTDVDHQGDMSLIVVNKSSWQGVGAATAALGVCLYSPHSRGFLTIPSADPTAMPAVHFGALTDARDVDRMTDGFMLAGELMRDDRCN